MANFLRLSGTSADGTGARIAEAPESQEQSSKPVSLTTSTATASLRAPGSLAPEAAQRDDGLRVNPRRGSSHSERVTIKGSFLSDGKGAADRSDAAATEGAANDALQ